MRSRMYYKNVEEFCKKVTEAHYGGNQLTVKCNLSCGELAFYQKSHEVGTDDWSAEGEPFVKAARLEAAMKSSQTIYFYTDDYNAAFKKPLAVPGSGTRCFWEFSQGDKKVPGLNLPNNLVNVTSLEYIPGGRPA